jgi:G3E family GTPase
MSESRIPVTILTGFLGSGKTTLLNQIVRQNPDKHFAIIENEFGEMGIDAELVVGVDGDIFELSNGCVCCTLNEELANTLHILAKRERKIDHLIIETTGIADPGPVALSFLVDLEIQELFVLDAIVCVVDVRNVERQLETQTEVAKQVMLANVLLLNKTDLVDAYTLETCQNIVKRINPDAIVYQTSHSNIETQKLFDIKAFDAQTLTEQASSSSNKKLDPQSLRPNFHIQLGSHSIEIEAPIDIVKFDAWVSMLLYFNKESIYRIKGILQMDDSDEKVVFQSVHDQYVSQSVGKWAENEKRSTRLVFIGKNLRKEDLEKGLNQCVALRS